MTVRTDPQILVTGGAGFIGTALSRRLLARGCRVVAMDCLHPQVHRDLARPAELPTAVELFPSDVSHEADWRAVLRLIHPDTIVHLAAETGTGQSLVEASRHARVNVLGTTTLAEALMRTGNQVPNVVLASSRAVYGEGAWASEDGGIYWPGVRSHTALAQSQWIPLDPSGRPGRPLPSVAGVTHASPSSVYASTKLAQEHILSAWAAATGARLSILRLQNVYGPGQSLHNAYTGIVTLFAQQARNREVIDIYEDGKVVRDFIFIDDVAAALEAAVLKPPDARRLLDIGSGDPIPILDLATRLATMCGAPGPEVSGRFRDGDIRAAWCDAEPAKRELDWDPNTTLDAGLARLLDWIASADAPAQPR